MLNDNALPIFEKISRYDDCSLGYNASALQLIFLLLMWFNQSPKNNTTLSTFLSLHVNVLLAVEPTQNVRGVDLDDEPAVSLVCVGAKNGEDGAPLPRLRQ